ncbi:MAG: hypothetical protein CO094_10010 [Anaerolineae bacterium CG_4_9_14_3_um_filter_57_17]|nr:MAG: hypothetical protein CO094_10010 [Anaerolineae bacterium CG_4_9_14_3_um_filter_57_17]
MNAKTFGKMIASLRRERRNQHGLPTTQKQLAQEMGLSPTIISNIERGIKATIEPDTLLRLTNALRISPRQRREFLLCAVRANELDFLEISAQQSLEKALTMLRGLALPAFVVDTYDNLLAANYSLLTLFDYSETMRQQAESRFAGYNVLRFVFSQNSPFLQNALENQDAYLLQSISFFQSMTLPWMATRYYTQLMTDLTESPDMQALRDYLARSADNKQETLFEDVFVALRHARFGELRFFSPPLTPVASPAGSLYLVAYLPADKHTAQVFMELAQQGYGQITLLQSFPVEGHDEEIEFEEEDLTSDTEDSPEPYEQPHSPAR